MVSRRKILSRSRDDLNSDQPYQPEEDEDVWFQKEKLYKEHLVEVLEKWNQIDDEIWAKVIVFEKNRRVAKAYARSSMLHINGSADDFDGMRIGLSSFDNPMRDPKTEDLRKHVGEGAKIKMDSTGNILIRRYSRNNVFVRGTAASINDETAIGSEIQKNPNQPLETAKTIKLFDMNKFQANINRELRQAYPDRRRLEMQCLCSITFVRNENELLECPIWVLIINIVAMDMLRSKMPIMERPVTNVRSRPRLPIPDEDPYSLATSSGENSDSSGYGTGNGSGHQGANSGVIRDQMVQLPAHKRIERPPPQLPPRDNGYSHDIPKPDYEDTLETHVNSKLKTLLKPKMNNKDKDKKKAPEDPYYCGLSARVPKFAKLKQKTKKTTEVIKDPVVPKQRMSVAYLQHPNAFFAPFHYQSQQHLMMAPPPRSFYPQQQYPMWHAKSMESGLDHPAEFSVNSYESWDRVHPKTAIWR